MNLANKVSFQCFSKRQFAVFLYFFASASVLHALGGCARTRMLRWWHRWQSCRCPPTTAPSSPRAAHCRRAHPARCTCRYRQSVGKIAQYVHQEFSIAFNKIRWLTNVEERCSCWFCSPEQRFPHTHHKSQLFFEFKYWMYLLFSCKSKFLSEE